MTDSLVGLLMDFIAWVFGVFLVWCLSVLGCLFINIGSEGWLAAALNVVLVVSLAAAARCRGDRRTGLVFVGLMLGLASFVLSIALPETVFTFAIVAVQVVLALALTRTARQPAPTSD
jgi:hypothetical protein